MHLAGAEQKEHVFPLTRLDGGTITTGLRYARHASAAARRGGVIQ